MSAITGIIHFNDEPIPIEHGNGLMQALQKFPADDVQTWRKDNVFLGCHAQWITPESVGEQLPFYDYQRQLAITADAIIDNREELFERLQIHREDRKKITDSQLILLAYEKWGEESPKFLVGDFAYMIWDEKERKLFGARDFSGGRTLYYSKFHKKFAFCTTIEPLISLPYIDKKLNEQWLAEFLAIPGMNDTVDTTITPYLGIEQLSPSHCISITDGNIVSSRYFKINGVELLRLKSNHEYEEAFRDIFQRAVKDRLRTNRNVGAHLSGGLDSGSVVSYAARFLKEEKKQLHTFSYVPPEDFIDWTPKSLIADERPYIKSTVQYVGNISDHYFNFAEVNPLEEVDDWLSIMEMPYKFFANSNWLNGIFQQAQKQGIGVLLNGGRGNLSISWGSALDYYSILLKKLKWICLFKELDQYSKNVGGNRLRRLPVIGKIAFPFVGRIFQSGDSIHFPNILNLELAKRTNVFEKLKEHGISDSPYQSDIYDARKKHFRELFSWNATGTLGAKLSLRYGLWKRDPTNDIRVILYCLSVPEDQYVQNGLDRALIRRATNNMLPDKVRLNQRVRGVQGADCVHRMAPFWNEFVEELEQLSKDQIISEFLNQDVLKAAISKIKQGPRPEYSFEPEYQISMFNLIIYRFIKNFI